MASGDEGERVGGIYIDVGIDDETVLAKLNAIETAMANVASKEVTVKVNVVEEGSTTPKGARKQKSVIPATLELEKNAAKNAVKNLQPVPIPVTLSLATDAISKLKAQITEAFHNFAIKVNVEYGTATGTTPTALAPSLDQEEFAEATGLGGGRTGGHTVRSSGRRPPRPPTPTRAEALSKNTEILDTLTKKLDVLQRANRDARPTRLENETRGTISGLRRRINILTNSSDDVVERLLTPERPAGEKLERERRPQKRDASRRKNIIRRPVAQAATDEERYSVREPGAIDPTGHPLETPLPTVRPGPKDTTQLPRYTDEEEGRLARYDRERRRQAALAGEINGRSAGQRGGNKFAPGAGPSRFTGMGIGTYTRYFSAPRLRGKEQPFEEFENKAELSDFAKLLQGAIASGNVGRELKAQGRAFGARERQAIVQQFETEPGQQMEFRTLLARYLGVAPPGSRKRRHGQVGLSRYRHAEPAPAIGTDGAPLVEPGGERVVENYQGKEFGTRRERGVRMDPNPQGLAALEPAADAILRQLELGEFGTQDEPLVEKLDQEGKRIGLRKLTDAQRVRAIREQGSDKPGTKFGNFRIVPPKSLAQEKLNELGELGTAAHQLVYGTGAEVNTQPDIVRRGLLASIVPGQGMGFGGGYQAVSRGGLPTAVISEHDTRQGRAENRARVRQGLYEDAYNSLDPETAALVRALPEKQRKRFLRPFTAQYGDVVQQKAMMRAAPREFGFEQPAITGAYQKFTEGYASREGLEGYLREDQEVTPASTYHASIAKAIDEYKAEFQYSKRSKLKALPLAIGALVGAQGNKVRETTGFMVPDYDRISRTGGVAMRRVPGSIEAAAARAEPPKLATEVAREPRRTYTPAEEQVADIQQALERLRGTPESIKTPVRAGRAGTAEEQRLARQGGATRFTPKKLGEVDVAKYHLRIEQAREAGNFEEAERLGGVLAGTRPRVDTASMRKEQAHLRELGLEAGDLSLPAGAMAGISTRRPGSVAEARKRLKAAQQRQRGYERMLGPTQTAADQERRELEARGVDLSGAPIFTDKGLTGDELAGKVAADKTIGREIQPAPEEVLPPAGVDTGGVGTAKRRLLGNALAARLQQMDPTGAELETQRARRSSLSRGLSAVEAARATALAPTPRPEPIPVIGAEGYAANVMASIPKSELLKAAEAQEPRVEAPPGEGFPGGEPPDKGKGTKSGELSESIQKVFVVNWPSGGIGGAVDEKAHGQYLRENLEKNLAGEPLNTPAAVAKQIMASMPAGTSPEDAAAGLRSLGFSKTEANEFAGIGGGGKKGKKGAPSEPEPAAPVRPDENRPITREDFRKYLRPEEQARAGFYGMGQGTAAQTPAFETLVRQRRTEADDAETKAKMAAQAAAAPPAAAVPVAEKAIRTTAGPTRSSILRTAERFNEGLRFAEPEPESGYRSDARIKANADILAARSLNPTRAFTTAVAAAFAKTLGGGSKFEERVQKLTDALNVVGDVGEDIEKNSKALANNQKNIELNTTALAKAQALPEGREKVAAVGTATAAAATLEEERGELTAKGAELKPRLVQAEDTARQRRRELTTPFGVARSFGALATGAVIGGIAFNAYAQLIQGAVTVLEDAAGKAADALSGFANTASKVTADLASAIKQGFGNEGAVAGAVAPTGISAEALQSLNGQGLSGRAEAIAAAQARVQESDLFRTANNLSGDKLPGGYDKALFQGTGGVFNSSLLAPQPGFLERITGDLQSNLTPIPMTPEQSQNDAFLRSVTGQLPGAVPRQSPNYNSAPGPQITGEPGVIPAATPETKRQVDDFNKQLERTNSGFKYLTNATDTQKTAMLESAKSIGQEAEAQKLLNANVAIVGKNGQALEGTEFGQAIAEHARGQLTVDPRVAFEADKRQMEAAIRSNERQLQRELTVTQPRDAALSALAAPALAPGTGTFASNDKQGDEAERIAAATKETAGYQATLNSYYDKGNALLKAGLSSQPGLYKDIEETGKAIVAVQTQIAEAQGKLQTHEYNNQLRIAQRSLNDIAAITGKRVKGEYDGLGYLQKQNVELSRQSEQLQQQLQQRQINFQLAIAGFTVAGESPEERAARIKDAKTQAEFAQKQLDIQKKLFGNSIKVFDVENARAFTDAVASISLLREGRQVAIDTKLAEEKLARLNKIQDINVKKAGAVLGTIEKNIAVAESEMFKLESAYGKALNDISVNTIKGFITTIDKMYAYLEGVNLQPTGTGRTDAGGGKVRHARGTLFDTDGPTTMTVGEAGTETVAVLRNPRTASVSGMGGGGGVTININNPVVREENDLRKITNSVIAALNTKTALLGLR